MPIKNSAKKYVRVTKRRMAINRKRKIAARVAVKETLKSIASANVEASKKSFIKAQKALDKAAKSGLIKKASAARRKARLAKKIKNLSIKK